MFNTDNLTGAAEAKAETDSKFEIVETEENVITRQPYPEYIHSIKSSRRIGLRGSAPYQPPKGNDPLNYDERYPEDALCEEMGPNARVFRTYLDERGIFDANMVKESRDVDVLLVFAGLFSAVVTTSVAQTSRSLQADYTEIALLQAGPPWTLVPSPLNPNTSFIASTTSIWVNGLWFTSLALGLTTALVSVLVKQWLHHYMALPSGTPRERSLLRQFRFAGLQKWRVLIIIGSLPVLMHATLAVFFIVLVIFLELESQAAQSVSGELSVEALHELFSMSSNPAVQSIVIQAIGGLHSALQSKAQGLFNDIGILAWYYGEMKLERLLRCKLFLSDESYIALEFTGRLHGNISRSRWPIFSALLQEAPPWTPPLLPPSTPTLLTGNVQICGEGVARSDGGRVRSSASVQARHCRVIGVLSERLDLRSRFCLIFKLQNERVVVGKGYQSSEDESDAYIKSMAETI
ncbi:hypothetical protein IW261DRAFT_1417647 [Armillaria novae-zelandiae]|uniref:DUF6535 domain-containing protein n=1 Tax=Armillaria novae-zelandiae TaxID=153914 RepID=A0AA39PGN8_9AGAR|nr:hypothetical protein IW261DRAFT_1417647 [Armillaria novae-zelandiae]